eukprot:5084026-Amphidinium_carterae.1
MSTTYLVVRYFCSARSLGGSKKANNSAMLQRCTGYSHQEPYLLFSSCKKVLFMARIGATPLNGELTKWCKTGHFFKEKERVLSCYLMGCGPCGALLFSALINKVAVHCNHMIH